MFCPYGDSQYNREWVKVKDAMAPRLRKVDRGEPGKGLVQLRVAKLDALGFTWNLGLGHGCHHKRAGGTSGL